MQAFLAILTQNPLHSGRYVTSTDPPREHRQMTAHWQMTEAVCTSRRVNVHYDEVVCPNCMHTACNSMYFVRAAALCTTRTKEVCDLECSCIFIAVMLFYTVLHYLIVVIYLVIMKKWEWTVSDVQCFGTQNNYLQ